MESPIAEHHRTQRAIGLVLPRELALRPTVAIKRWAGSFVCVARPRALAMGVVRRSGTAQTSGCPPELPPISLCLLVFFVTIEGHQRGRTPPHHSSAPKFPCLDSLSPHTQPRDGHCPPVQRSRRRVFKRSGNSARWAADTDRRLRRQPVRVTEPKERACVLQYHGGRMLSLAGDSGICNSTE